MLKILKKETYDKLIEENERLKDEVSNLSHKNTSLETESALAFKVIDQQKAEKEKLVKENETLKKELEYIKSKKANASLEARKKWLKGEFGDK